MQLLARYPEICRALPTPEKKVLPCMKKFVDSHRGGSAGVRVLGRMEHLQAFLKSPTHGEWRLCHNYRCLNAVKTTDRCTASLTKDFSYKSNGTKTSKYKLSPGTGCRTGYAENSCHYAVKSIWVSIYDVWPLYSKVLIFAILHQRYLCDIHFAGRTFTASEATLWSSQRPIGLAVNQTC